MFSEKLGLEQDRGLTQSPFWGGIRAARDSAGAQEKCYYPSSLRGTFAPAERATAVFCSLLQDAYVDKDV